MPFVIPEINLIPLYPTIALALTVVLLMLGMILTKRRGGFILIPLAGIFAAGALTLSNWNGNGRAFHDSIAIDNTSLFLSLIVLGGAALTLLLATDFIRTRGMDVGEFYALLIGSTAGMLLMISANDLIVIFLALEVLSVPLYILSAFQRFETRSLEAGLKYFMLGAFSSAFFLYGIALVYGATATTNLTSLAAFLSKNAAVATNGFSPLLLAGAALLVVGFGFKVALVPFHWWTPDVYEGAPTPVTAFMSVATKTAAFAAFFRTFYAGLPALSGNWQFTLAIVAVFTMTLGNVAALMQTNIKRMLAYSSIAHAGYILIAFVVQAPDTLASASFYLLAYTAMNLGAFGALIALGDGDRERVTFPDLAGAAGQKPLPSLVLALCLLSLAGFPPLAGFLGKFFIFRAAIESGWTWLAIVGVLNSLVSVYFYLGPIVQMYMGSPRAEWKKDARVPALLTVAVLIAALATVALGILPFGLDFAQASVLR